VPGRDGRAGTERDHDRRLSRLTRLLGVLGSGGLGRRVELGEEAIGGGLALALAAPHHAAAAVIADQRQVAVAPSPRDLVDRDLEQIAQPVGVDQLLADALDDPPDRLPVDPHQPAGRGLVGLGRQPRDQVFEVAREARAVASERDALHVHAMLGATQPPQPGADLEPPDPQIEMPPDRVVMLAALAMPRGVRALRAPQATMAQHDRDEDSIGLEADRADPHPRQSSKRENALVTRMGDDLQFAAFRGREPTVRTCARRPTRPRHPASSEETLLRPRTPRRS
jgi:hypothetical protein